MIIQIDQPFTHAQQDDALAGRNLFLNYTLKPNEVQRAVAVADSHDLRSELEDRGYEVLDCNEQSEIDNIIDAGNILVDLITGLKGAIVVKDAALVAKLTEAIIFAATGETLELEADVQEAA